jgi:hypothetical protein
MPVHDGGDEAGTGRGMLGLSWCKGVQNGPGRGGMSGLSWWANVPGRRGPGGAPGGPSRRESTARSARAGRNYVRFIGSRRADAAGRDGEGPRRPDPGAVKYVPCIVDGGTPGPAGAVTIVAIRPISPSARGCP